jgi:hypothetical protein
MFNLKELIYFFLPCPRGGQEGWEILKTTPNPSLRRRGK